MANSTTVQNRVRIGGAGFTIFTFGGQPIAFCEQVRHTSPQAVSQFSAIQPLDEPYPTEILVAPAAGPGQLILNLFELFGSGGAASKVWDRLGAENGGNKDAPFGAVGQTDQSQYLQLSKKNKLAGAVDIVDIFLRQAQMDPTQLNITKIVRPLTTTGGVQPYVEEYEGCKIVDVADGEQIAVGKMEIIKQITVAYRYIRRDGNPSGAFAFRDSSINGKGFNSTQF